jgi:GntR family transcriptional regulator
MAANWNDNQPIYRQLRDKVVGLILDDMLTEGDALPSVRNVAAEYQLNPITVSKGYQELVDEGLVEKRRGLGMFVLEGAKARLLEAERDQFMREELPAFIERVDRLGIDPRKLLKKIEQVREGEDK